MIANEPLWSVGVDEWPAVEVLTDKQTTTDVVVVGLGGSGLTALEECHRRGMKCIGLDRGRVAWCAAGRNGGFVLAGLHKFYHDTVEWLGRGLASKIYRETVDEIDRQRSEWPGEFKCSGGLRIAGSVEEEADCRAHMEALLRDGFDAEWYDGELGKGICILSDGSFNPLRYHVKRACQLQRDGVRLYQDSPVVSVLPNAVTTRNGATIVCKKIIVAVDGRLQEMFPAGVIRPPLHSVRLQMLGTEPVPDTKFALPVYRRNGMDYFQQLEDGRVVLGGFRDVGGDDEVTSDPTPSDKVQTHLEHYLRNGLGIDAPISHRWGAVVTFTNDGVPVADEVFPGVWAVGAYNGTGNMIGAACARGAAMEACGEASPLLRCLRLARARSNSQSHL